MKLIARTSTRLELKLLKLPFQLYFSWTRKRGVDKDFWFTPTGNGKLYSGNFNTERIGKIPPKKYEAIISMMKKGRCDILTDGYRYYTTTGDNWISQIHGLSSDLALMKEEYQARKDWEGWEDIKKV